MYKKALRSVNTHFWDDNYVVNLDPIEKLLFLYFLTNPLTNLAGIYEISLRRIAFDTGIDRDMVQKILDRFKADNKIYYNQGFIILPNYQNHQNYNPSMERNVEKIMEKVPPKIAEMLPELTKNQENEQAGSTLSTKCPKGKGKSKDKGKDSQPVLQEIVDRWNLFAKANNLSQVIKLSEKRIRGVQARLKEKDFQFDKILSDVEKSNFLLGENKQGWKIDFDFIFLSAHNYIKILEGKYVTDKKPEIIDYR